MKFAIIGGDMRQAGLAEFLVKDGHKVSVFGLGDISSLATYEKTDVKSAAKGAEYVILPLPAVSNSGTLNAPLHGGEIKLDELVNAISPEQTVLAGRAGRELKELCDKRKIKLIDYFEREELAIKNAGSTAEGAVQILMEELPVTVQGMHVLIVGFGRIGKLLAMKLKALGAKVTVSARNFKDFAWIESMGYELADTRRLWEYVSTADAIVNTVPAKVIDKRVFEAMGENCLLLDLASKPGGHDIEEAAKMNIKVIWALSLPGKVAPQTSGMDIRDTVYNIISELECAD